MITQEVNYCIHPLVLHEQISRSLSNLGLSRLDCYYLNLPEVLLPHLSKEQFLETLVMAFTFLETQVEEGRISSYGLTCWNMGRQLTTSPFYFDFNDILSLVVKRIGPAHNLKFIQAPLSIGMPENFCELYATNPTTGGTRFDPSKTLIDSLVFLFRAVV